MKHQIGYPSQEKLKEQVPKKSDFVHVLWTNAGVFGCQTYQIILRSVDRLRVEIKGQPSVIRTL